MARSYWSSKLAFILATTGAAVGLGNVWKFPYMVGSFGGANFVLVYLIATLVLALPAMLGELIIGRMYPGNTISALKLLARANNLPKAITLLGYLGAMGLVLVLSFYSVVAGWTLAFLARSWLSTLPIDSHSLNALWLKLLSNPIELISWHALAMLSTMLIVGQGVKKGLELCNNIMLPLLLMLLVVLLLYAFKYGDFVAARNFLFNYHWSQFNSSNIMHAIGQACFSLATGAGCMVVYGSYIPSQQRFLAGSTLIVAVLNILVSLCAALAIFPLVFKAQLAVSSGPGLMFQTLPLAFAHMPYGAWCTSLFFIVLCFAAITSSISMAEPLVIILTENYKYSRLKATTIIGALCFTLGIGACLSFNIWSDYKILSRDIFTLLADSATIFILPIGTIGFCLVASYITPNMALQQALGLRGLTFKLWRLLLRYVIPIVVGSIFLHNLMLG